MTMGGTEKKRSAFVQMMSRTMRTSGTAELNDISSQINSKKLLFSATKRAENSSRMSNQRHARDSMMTTASDRFAINTPDL